MGKIVRFHEHKSASFHGPDPYILSHDAVFNNMISNETGKLKFPTLLPDEVPDSAIPKSSCTLSSGPDGQVQITYPTGKTFDLYNHKYQYNSSECYSDILTTSTPDFSVYAEAVSSGCIQLYSAIIITRVLFILGRTGYTILKHCPLVLNPNLHYSYHAVYSLTKNRLYYFYQSYHSVPFLRR